MPELAGATVFEVDHPASQRDKLRRIGDLAPTAGGSSRWPSTSRPNALRPALERAPASIGRP